MPAVERPREAVLLGGICGAIMQRNGRYWAKPLVPKSFDKEYVIHESSNDERRARARHGPSVA